MAWPGPFTGKPRPQRDLGVASACSSGSSCQDPPNLPVQVPSTTAQPLPTESAQRSCGLGVYTGGPNGRCEGTGHADVWGRQALRGGGGLLSRCRQRIQAARPSWRPAFLEQTSTSSKLSAQASPGVLESCVPETSSQAGRGEPSAGAACRSPRGEALSRQAGDHGCSPRVQLRPTQRERTF